MNRFVWDLRCRPVDSVDGAIVWGFLGGPKVAPGNYNVTLSLGNWKQTQTFRVVKDPRVKATDADLQAQFDLMMQINAKMDQLYQGVKAVRSVRQQARDTAARKENQQVTKAADDLWNKLTGIEEELMQPKNQADQDTENFPTKLDNQLAYISMILNDTDSRPTDGETQRVQDLFKEIDKQLTQLKGILNTDVAAFNQLAAQTGNQAVTVPGN